MSYHRSLMVVMLVLVGLATTVVADVPRLISYQGRLTDAAGTAVADGNYQLTFYFYDAATGGNQLWTSGPATVPVAGGLFTYPLGSQEELHDSLFTGLTELWLAMQVDAGPESSPRVQLTSSAFAYRAFRADMASTADSSTNSGYASLADTAQYAFAALDADTAGFAAQALHAEEAVTASSALYADSAGAVTDGAVDFADIGQNGAAPNQIMKWNGSAWIPVDDETGTGWNWQDSSSHGPDSVLYSDTALYAADAGFAVYAGHAATADTADYAFGALQADTADFAHEAAHAEEAQTAVGAQHADSAVWTEVAACRHGWLRTWRHLCRRSRNRCPRGGS